MYSNKNSFKEIDEEFKTYEELRKWRDEQIHGVSKNHEELNRFHDEIMTKVILSSIKKLESEQGKPPARFAFIVMGSAGRCEQSIWSDQDHGFIFEGEEAAKDYFLKLGEEIVEGLSICGYEKCEGKVMANNPLWCRSCKQWKEQIDQWLDEESWESLRNTSIFIDARVLIGNKEFLQNKKQQIFTRLEDQPHLLKRMGDNVESSKKSVGWFGQLIPVQKGKNKGMINFKETVLFPFVNALRLSAYLEQIEEPSTIGRFQALENCSFLENDALSAFKEALQFRLSKTKVSQNYDNVHFLEVERLSKQDKTQIKKWIDQGDSLMKQVMKQLKNKGREEGSQ
ncbi:hypothetical protein CR194_06525 [Salipaludibacillus keqinensis]|uniref:Signal transduction protein n=1 Tax=Salipaludibacillus keqinensis TaxID=2045207 RepID=A0A323TZZ2_9BACI|nr:DUF294 nucleotidyltransferase-like domain-containing protein [Salipaludibacillus keqinensis]PYZ95165.1 hypothetical protein CR194_06525 [Salipaludibacillus keqinensis]